LWSALAGPNTLLFSSQHSCFSRKFHPLLVIVHPRSGSRHVVRPSVVTNLVLSTRSSYISNESWILTKPPAGISWHRDQVLPITGGISCSRRRQGSYTAVGIEGASRHVFLRMNSDPCLSIGFLTICGWCVEFCLEGSISLLHSLCSSISVCSSLLLQHSRFASKTKSVIAGTKWYAAKWSRT